MNDQIEKVLDLVLSSARRMPAHYSSNGDRTKSFCIDFDIDAEDEYNMASYTFYKGHDALVTLLKPSEVDKAVVIKVGEDIIIGSYILTKLDGSSHTAELMKNLISENTAHLDIDQSVLTDQEVQNYFAACQQYGTNRAQM